MTACNFKLLCAANVDLRCDKNLHCSRADVFETFELLSCILRN